MENEYKDFCFLFLKELEYSGIGCIIREKELWFEKIDVKNKDAIIMVLDNMITMYYDMLKLYGEKNSLINYEEYRDEFCQIVDKNNLDSIINKIRYLVDAKDSVKFNVNSNLLVDRIILEVGGYNEHCRC